MKEISNYFSVTIDDLLSGEKLIVIAEKENKSNMQSMCNFLLGMIDVFSVIFIILPLYPNTINGYVYSVNLLAYVETTSLNRAIHWILYVALIVVGIVKLLLAKLKIQKKDKLITMISMILHIVIVLFLAMTRESYAIMVVFLLFIIKGVVLLVEKE